MSKSRRLKKNLKQFGKKRVDVSKYVKDFYVDNGLAYISCNVKNYYDIIDPYSVKGYEWLNGSFTRFLEENANYVPTEYPIVLEICGGKFTKRQKEVITETIADYYALKMGDTQLAIEKNRTKYISLLVFGLIFAVVFWLNTKYQIAATLSEVGSILFWFLIWTFFDLAWLERNDLVEARTDAAQMASIKVMFLDYYEDGPVTEDEEEEIIEEIFEETEILPYAMEEEQKE